MSKFCTRCGNLLNQSSRFCTSCGHPIPLPPTAVAQTPNHGSSIPMQPLPPKKKLPRWLIFSLAGATALLFLTAIGFGIWKAGDVTGVWNDRALKRAASAWSRQPGYKTEEKAIKETLDGLAATLAVGDIPKSLTFFHDDVKEEYAALLNENASRLGELADIVRSHHITYLSTTSEYYLASRTATLTAGISQSASPSPGVVHIVMVKTENGWVVYTLR